MRKPIMVLAAALVAVSACAPGSGNARPTQKPPSAVSTDIAKAGPVTLTVWDQEVLGGQNEQMQKLNAAFHAEYPNVTIKRVSRSFSDLEKTLRLALSGDNPPDVVEANQGYGIMAALVKAGALASLDGYDKVYGFRKRFPAGVSQLNSVTPDGKTIGSGSLYGVSMTGEAVGIYYNTDKLAKLGVPAPASWVRFEQDLALAKSKGETPIYFANLEKFPAIHEFGVLLGQTADKGALRNLVFGRGGAWTDAPVVAAASELAGWAKNGYFPKTANAGRYNDSPAAFAKGDGVFLIGGPWFAADLEKKMGAKVRFMLPPPANVGQGQPSTLGGPGLPLAITSKSRHPDVAAAYLDFMTTPQAMDVVTQTGGLAAAKPASAEPATPVGRDVFGAYRVASDDDILVPYLDYSTTTFLDTLGAALQEIIAGRKTPQEGMRDAQRDYAAFLAKK
ncbi:extracellular solute-binding protein [Actinoallomurus bryophytorum]|uniref:Carbohydrate ABC transporter substrate-binding protein (CUT1 family) n=1 Tax=Actinoallomurus bryophytorum TaxID=1490222 RepID=A0A543CNQ9_9ACTN|nr:extracellular solute-binding protein [Actinoallomurus bryophytorum]TQL98748.1 carbohydrate ABC transporter substrate-binding protein (CUT1 family) [Actinoallomurus bryophytorum]